MASLTREQKQNILAGIILLIYGVWIFAGSLSFTGVGRSGEPGPGILPRIAGILIIFLSILLLLITLVELVKANKSSTKTVEPKIKADDKKSIALTFALFVLYIFSLSPLGFIVSSTVYIFLQIIVLSVNPQKKQFIVFAIVALVVPTLTYLIFVRVFNLMLPRGIIG